MKFEAKLFLFPTPFFVFIGIVYALWSGWEPVGSTALLLTAGLTGMIGFYLWLVGRRIDPRPEDDAFGEIEEGAGDLGVYSPGSWWPIAIAAAGAICFLGLAVGWWLFYIGSALTVITLVGWVYEFSRGQHAH
ncbi:cytochrome c oxidase subunit 4 [Cellulomonas bogoriensis]|uniref:Cytochrome c oxidase polypeptide 4 n=1 Tax=Cellulomonas bogoriensis 69B4 = DSM 16987 TaxID=1386082 RepID=A0A0A0C0K4_9CELL|nr:cytochrome c oxidase subunit 4 [Cellulomonas bogoriensis]KGM12954.1 cytochrome C oxidase subunit IV [Cellulomonas bogoriensis 69B4 = DSM 16987]